MPSTTPSLLNYLRVVTGAWRDDLRDDAELLTRFAENGDEAAFRALVWRHGPLVWQTCRRILDDTPDAEDTFQATFLALVRKAGQFPVASLAGWLHRVARQTALDARASARRRRVLEQRLRAGAQPAAEEEASRAELYAVLDEELADLPERLRVPLVLRYLEGKTLAEVARVLGCSLTPLTKRLARGEAILRQQLERRGLTVGIVSVGALLASTAPTSAVPTLLIGSTARAAVAFRSGTLTGGTMERAGAALQSLSFSPRESFKATALAERMMKTMLTTKVKIVTVLLGVTLCLVGGGVLAYQTLAGNTLEPAQLASEIRGETEASGQPGAAARVDCYGDPLPVGALARLGTVRLRHPDGISSVALSSDGKIVASAGNDGTVRLWDAATGKEIRTLRGHQKRWVNSVAFASDGRTVASAGSDGTVRLWEVATGKEIRTLRRHQGEVRVAFSPDGKIMASGGQDKIVCLWEVATGKQIRTLQGHKKQVNSVAFASGGETVASGGEDSTVRLWNVATGKEIRTLQGHQGQVWSVAFASDGKTVASGGEDSTVHLWEVGTGKEIRTLGGHQGWVTSVVFASDGKTVASGGQDGTVGLWDVTTGKEIRTLQGHKGGISSVAFSSDGKTVASGSWDSTVRLWNVATGKENRTQGGHQGKVHSVAFASDGRTVASAGSDGTVRLWEVATGKEIRSLGHTGLVWSVAFSSDGKTVASVVSWDGGVHLWDVVTGKEIRTLQGPKGGDIRSVAFSSDGKTVVASGGSRDNTVCLWDVATGKEIRALQGHKSQVCSVAFSSDGKTVASGGSGNDNTVRLWEVATGKEIRTLQGHKGLVWSVAFSSDGKTVVSGGLDGTVRLWEVATGKEIQTLKGHKGEVLSVAFSSDGKTVASAGTDGTVRLWEVATSKEIQTLKGHKGGEVLSVAFSSDGKILASGSGDTTGLIWDVTFLGRLKPVTAPLLAPRPLPKEQLEAAWTDLAKDPAKAYAAIGALQAVPTQAISLLRARMRPAAPLADAQQLKHWIADLDAASFTVRDKAQREIEKLGAPAIPALRQALKGQPSLETKRRLQGLLAELEPKEVSPDRLRELRAVQVLESIGTTEARQLLQAWAMGAPEARLTQEAEAALAHWTKRSATRP